MPVQIAIRITCKSCLEPRVLDAAGLCSGCSELDDRIDHTLSALLAEVNNV
jgi:hypothetical protein